jgi:hypothetical protein
MVFFIQLPPVHPHPLVCFWPQANSHPPVGSFGKTFSLDLKRLEPCFAIQKFSMVSDTSAYEVDDIDQPVTLCHRLPRRLNRQNQSCSVPG